MMMSTNYTESQPARPAITVVVAVYNNFKWLRLILDALQMQTFRDFEVAIADDGSSRENVAMLSDYIERNQTLRVIHAWHEDRGWRKNMALNNALRKSTGEYIVFIDGDCIPHPRFLEDHYRLRRKGYLMGGRRVESSQAVTDMIEGWERLPADFFSRARRCVLSRMFSGHFSESLSQLKRMWRFPFFPLRALAIKKQGILGANFGVYRSDLELVNGFDERYLHPGTGEDCDLDVRMENAGIQHLKTSRYALMIHRHHARLDWSDPENARLLEEARNNKTTRVDSGLNKL